MLTLLVCQEHVLTYNNGRSLLSKNLTREGLRTNYTWVRERMNTSDDNCIGYFFATLHTLDIFSTSKSATSKNAYQARIQAFIVTIGITWLKTQKEWGQKSEHWFEPVLNIHMPISPILTQFFLISPASTQQGKKTILRHKKYGRGICSFPSKLCLRLVCVRAERHADNCLLLGKQAGASLILLRPDSN
jgi:hypothetical protein